MEILSVQGLCKRYPGFALDHVSFTLEKGRIMGLIGRNGAGKTTVLRSIQNLVHPDAGEIRYFSLPFSRHELEIRQRIGFAAGGVNFYSKKRLKTITAVTRKFYPGWDENRYRDLLRRFALDEKKTPDQLSAGMRVKYALALALSHRAELLILDEPTSGLDPVSRDELLTLLMELARKGVSILFSTHIISDLEKCADDITYIQMGKIFCSQPLSVFAGNYLLVEGDDAVPLSPEFSEKLLGKKIAKAGFTALLEKEYAPLCSLPCRPASLEEIMIHLEKECEEA